MLKEYYRLAKPGIVYGNVLTTIAAYLYVSHWHLTTPLAWAHFLATVFGLGLVIGSGCTFNNFFDRDIDKKMKRTQGRALATGAIPTENALLFGAILGLIGFTLLVGFVNILSAFIALIGFVVYVFAYTLLKRSTRFATEIGSISGAVPIVVGYTAVTGRFDWAALILFLIMVAWQMPHFYAIAMFRSSDYAAAKIPVLPLVQGKEETVFRIIVYIVAFALAVFALAYFGYAGYWYLLVTEVVALVWFWRSVGGYQAADPEAWARKLFFFSLTVLLTFSAMLSVASILP